MTDQHPITPPRELVEQWEEQWCDMPVIRPSINSYMATQAAQWGADMELEACCAWLPKLPPWSANDLRKHRRPKPPSLAKRALHILGTHGDLSCAEHDTICRALEALDD